LRLALSETAPALLNTQLLPRRGSDKLLHARDRVCKRHRRLRSMAVAAVPPTPPRYARPYCPPTALVVTPDRHVAKKTAAQGGLGSRRNETGSPRGCLCVGACALDAAMRPLIFAAATLLVSAGAASPQNPQHVTPGDRPAPILPETIVTAPDASGTPIKETTGQALHSEDGWSAQGGVPYLPPNASLPHASTPPSDTIGQSPAMSKKMGAEMESAGDLRAAPDEE
jgi:hypothetical protein